MSLYALMLPSKTLVADTVSSTKRECWGKSFDHVAFAEGEAWRSKYWKRWDASVRDARKRGYRVVKVSLVLSK